jgi:hypothetical protein
MPEERQHDEKEEKQEKQEEKEEKSWEEKWRRDPLNAAIWAVIIIWGGLVLLASNLELLTRFERLDGWEVFFVGAGLILLVEIAFRQLVPAYRQPVLGNLILAVVFLAIGLGGIIGSGVVWALAVIAVGVYILFRGLFRNR